MKTKADKHKNVKKLEPNFNLGKATATIALKDGTTAVITRYGYMEARPRGFYVYAYGSKILDYYLTDGKDIKKDDLGRYFTVSQIESIEVKQEDYYVGHGG